MFGSMSSANGTRGEVMVNTSEDVLVRVFGITAMGVFTLAVAISNFLCFLVLLSDSNSGEISRIFMLSLTASDLLIGVTMGALNAVSMLIGSWPFGHELCVITSVLNFTLISVTGTCVLAVNMERFVTIMWPLRSVQYITVHRALMAVAAIWIWAISLGLMYGLLPGRLAHYDSHIHLCIADPTDEREIDAFGIFSSVTLALMFGICVMLYAKLYTVARYHSRAIFCVTTRDHQLRSTRRPLISKADIKTATTFFAMTVVLGISWLPGAILLCYEGITRRDLPTTLVVIIQTLGLANSFWNVLIYYCRNESFRRAARKLARSCVKKVQPMQPRV